MSAADSRLVASRTVPNTSPLSRGAASVPQAARHSVSKDGTARTTRGVLRCTGTRTDTPDSPRLSKAACCMLNTRVPSGTLSMRKRPFASLRADRPVPSAATRAPASGRRARLS